MTSARIAASRGLEHGAIVMEHEREISVVLCRVRESGNVGSICRAMKTMGVERLILADCPEYEEAKVRMMAVHAYDVFEKARRYETLSAALGEFPLSAGFSRRKGERRKGASESLREFVGHMTHRSPAPLALVFGNESDGLTDGELGLCSLAVHIPTSDSFPSLNVAQAVQVACYEFFASTLNRTAADGTLESAPDSATAASPARSHTTAPAPRSAVESEISTIAGALAKAGFFRKSDDTHMKRFPPGPLRAGRRDPCRNRIPAQDISQARRPFRRSFDAPAPPMNWMSSSLMPPFWTFVHALFITDFNSLTFPGHL